MIIFHNFGDAGFSPCSPRLKQMPLPLGLAIAGIASSVLGTGANALMQKRANEQNIANQNSLYNKQKEYQNFLNANGMLIQKQAMQRAGFNPNAQFGTSANLQSPTPSKSDIVAPQLDTAGINAMLQQYPNLLGSYEDYQFKKRDNERRGSEDLTYEMLDVIDTYEQEEKRNKAAGNAVMSTQLPEVIVPRKNKGWFDAMSNFTKFKGERSDISVRMLNNELQELVTTRQLGNPKVLDALENMPWRTSDNLIAMTNQAISNASKLTKEGVKIDAETAYINLKKQIEEDSNIFQYVGKFFDGDFTPETFAKLLVLAVMKLVSK